jgi:hypothetical protein
MINDVKQASVTFLSLACYFLEKTKKWEVG